ncbi:M23 family metallopeptidase [Vibrio parahaemolyticus]|nr:M23 family metallopeptidase [Vibrio parahaemolyticus]
MLVMRFTSTYILFMLCLVTLWRGLTLPEIPAQSRQPLPISSTRLQTLPLPAKRSTTTPSAMPPSLVYSFKQGDSLKKVLRTLHINRPALVQSIERYTKNIKKTKVSQQHLSLWQDGEGLPYTQMTWCDNHVCWKIDLTTSHDMVPCVLTARPGAQLRPIQTPWRSNLTLQEGERVDVLLTPSLTTQDIRAFRVHKNGQITAAYRHKDGHFYTANGRRTLPPLSHRPVQDGTISSPFDVHRVHPVTGQRRPHLGTDFPVPDGTPVKATGEGVVRIARYSNSAGHYIEIEHDKHYRTRYLHLSHLLVQEGQTVQRGQQIGFSGHSGLSSGPHLHYELIKDGHPVDAMRALASSTKVLRRSELKSFQQQTQDIVWFSIE